MSESAAVLVEMPPKSLEEIVNTVPVDKDDEDSPTEQASPGSTESGPTPSGSSSSQQKPKRAQAQRACSNCKRLHARCDNERPCKRCIQAGLSASCVDIPRKRRMSRTYAEPSPDPMLANASWDRFRSPVSAGGPSHMWPPQMPMNGYGGIKMDPYSAMKNPHHPVNGPMDPGFDPSVLLSEIANPGEDHRNALSYDGLNQDALADSLLFHHLNTKQHTYHEPAEDYRSHSRMGWTSMMPQQEFALSVWKGTNTPGLNYLVECNDRFVELVGYPIEQLKNNFPCQKLFVSKGLSGHKRTQISTAYGTKDVYLTIFPLLGDLSSNKYFIVNMLELPPTKYPAFPIPHAQTEGIPYGLPASAPVPAMPVHQHQHQHQHQMSMPPPAVAYGMDPYGAPKWVDPMGYSKSDGPKAAPL